MNPSIIITRRHFGAALAAASLVWCGPARAHDYRAGAITAEHPYALPSAPGSPDGQAYLRRLVNRGDTADRLVGASASIAHSVELQTVSATGEATPVAAIEVPAASELTLRHDGPYRLALRGLRQPLVDGDRFDLTLHFERAGDLEVKVWVQTPRAAHTSHGAH